MTRAKRTYPVVPVAHRILRLITVHPKTRCWIWLGGGRGPGYGAITLPRPQRTELVHRASFEAFVGRVPDGIEVLHRCDRRRCVNPDHLFLGTQSDNILDCSKKGRLVDNRGERHGMAKLDESSVKQIRASTLSNGLLAQKFGVCDSTIRFIKSRKLWRHVS